MTISILKLDVSKGHTLPRPWNRACSLDEMKEMLATYCKANAWSFESWGPRDNRMLYQQYRPENLDREAPVLKILGASITFYAFTEK